MRLNKVKERQDYLFQEMSALLSAIASPVRLKIIFFLSQAPHSVEQLSHKIQQSVANTSMHLKKMQRENILKTEIKAQKRVYSLAQEEMKDFWEKIQDFALIHNSSHTISSHEFYQEELNWPESLDQAITLVKNNKAILLDTRPEDEVLSPSPFYNQYVRHIPYQTIAQGLKLPKSKIIFIFCRGRLCALSNESTFLLRRLGYKAYRLNHSWHKISQEILTNKDEE